jgi:hypothetical protein
VDKTRRGELPSRNLPISGDRFCDMLNTPDHLEMKATRHRVEKFLQMPECGRLPIPPT